MAPGTIVKVRFTALGTLVPAAGVAAGGRSGVTAIVTGLLFIAALVGFGLAMVAIFKPKAAPFLAPLYALCYGAALGAISAVYNLSYDGIVVQAVLATFSIFFVMLFLYVTRIIKVTKKFTMVVVALVAGCAGEAPTETTAATPWRCSMRPIR